jgi:2'-5' RNA ligase
MESIYNKMWDNALKAFENDELQLDPFIDDPKDLRRGISLLTKPAETLLNVIMNFIEEAKTVIPEQYFYKPEEIHTTVLSIINCFSGFTLSQTNLPDYIAHIKNSLSDIKPFEIEFKGITASPSCILIKGFTDNNMLELLRTNLREEFKRSSLYNSIDKRYKIETAHCTLIRFRKEINHKNNFVSFLKKYKNNYFGKSPVTELELVYTDWYNKKEIVQVLHKFKL